MMRRGYSRNHRPDCEQMVIALIVNSEGFPFSYETFDGNRADVSTMETILRMMERKYGKARRIWVFDRERSRFQHDGPAPCSGPQRPGGRWELPKLSERGR